MITPRATDVVEILIIAYMIFHILRWLRNTRAWSLLKGFFVILVFVGVAAVFMVQMTLNIFGSCNLIPFTGVTIPFISQGGSSMLASGILAGFLKAAQAPVLTDRSAAKGGK